MQRPRFSLKGSVAASGGGTLPGEAFERPGYFRLSLTATDAMVDRALPVLAGALQTLAPGGSQSAAASAP